MKKLDVFVTRILESRFAVLLLIIGAVLVRLPKLFSGLNEEYAFRQTQTALVARDYFNNGFDLFKSVLPVFGKEAQVPFEFPIFQALVAALSPTEAHLEFTGRSLSLFFFIATGVILALIMKSIFNRMYSVLFLAWYLFSPFSLEWGSAFLIENLAVFFGASSAYLYYLAQIKNSQLMIWASFLMAGSFLVKSTTAPTYCLLALGLVICGGSWPASWRQAGVFLAKLISLVGPGLTLALLWTRHSDQIKAQSPFTEKLTSASLMSWNFGTIDQRSELETYLVILNRIFQEIVGPAGFILIIWGLGISIKLGRKEVPILIGTAMASPLIFLNLYFVHSYYLSAIYPILIAAATGSASVVIGFLRKPKTVVWVSGALILVQIASYPFMPLARNDVRLLTANNKSPEVSRVIEENTTENDNLILIKCDWDPTYLYYAKRGGLMLPEWMFPGGPADMAQAISIYAPDATKLIFCVKVDDPQAYVPDNFNLQRIAGGEYAIFSITKTNES